LPETIDFARSGSQIWTYLRKIDALFQLIFLLNYLVNVEEIGQFITIPHLTENA